MNDTIKKRLALIIGLENKDAMRGVKQFDSALGGIDRTIKRLVASAAAFFGAWRMAGFIKEATLTAARTQVLGTALSVVGKQAGYSQGFLDRTEQTIKNLGISTQEARTSMTRFIQSELELADAAKVARVAQDLAVISGQNSSEAFEEITQAIVAQRPILLKQFGIVVGLNEIYDRQAKMLGKSADALTEYEKKQAFLNVILEKGEKVADVYESAMGNVGKQLTSLSRYWQEMQNTVGELFLPILQVAVDWVKNFAQELTELAEGPRGHKFREFIKHLAELLKKLGEKLIRLATQDIPEFFDKLKDSWVFKLVTDTDTLKTIGIIWVLTKALTLANELTVAVQGLGAASIFKSLVGAAGGAGGAVGAAGARAAGAGAAAAGLVLGTLAITAGIVYLADKSRTTHGVGADLKPGRIMSISEVEAGLIQMGGPQSPAEFRKGDFTSQMSRLTGFPLLSEEQIKEQSLEAMRRDAEKARLESERMREMGRVTAGQLFYVDTTGPELLPKGHGMGGQIGPAGPMSMPDLMGQFDERFQIEQDFRDKMSEAHLAFGEQGLNDAERLAAAEKQIQREKNDAIRAAESKHFSAMRTFQEQGQKILESTLSSHLTNIVLWRRTSLKEILKDLTEAAATQLATDAVVWAIEGFVLRDPVKLAGAAKAAAAAAAFGAAAVALGANDTGGGGGGTAVGGSSSGGSGVRTGTVTSGVPQNITISPSLSITGDVVYIGTDAITAGDAISRQMVQAMKDAISTGEIEV